VKVQHRQLWEEVADQIRLSILNGELAEGMKLAETEVASRYGVSRGPVREALRELSRESLVVQVPRRGAFVADVTDVDLQELYVVREGIEITAAKLALVRASDEDLDLLRVRLAETEKGWSKPDYAASIAADFAFHRTLFELAGNKQLLAIADQTAAQTMSLLQRAVQNNSSLNLHPSLSLRAARAVHRDLADAVLVRDLARAEKAIAAHYRFTTDRLFLRRAASSSPARQDPSTKERIANDRATPYGPASMKVESVDAGRVLSTSRRSGPEHP